METVAGYNYGGNWTIPPADLSPARSAASVVHRLYAFDILALDGDHLRKLPLSVRKQHLARLLARLPNGIFVASFEQGEIGPDLFRTACSWKLAGMVSKRADRPYRSGQSKDWAKVKNRKQAYRRVQDGF